MHYKYVLHIDGVNNFEWLGERKASKSPINRILRVSGKFTDNFLTYLL